MADRTSRTRHGRTGPPFWRRRWVVILAALFALLLIVSALSGGAEEASDDRAARRGAPTPTPTPSPTPDPAAAARAEAAALVADSEYLEAVGVLEDAGLDRAADRVRRRGARALLVAARRGLRSGRYEVAKADALDARQLRRTGEVRAALAAADAGIARERAAARERRRQARLARDLRTCTGAERQSVRGGAGVPPGCTAYAADLEARRAEREAELQAEQEALSAGAGCAPGYDPCVPPYPPDVDCADVGPVTVSGPDPHGLDGDGDGVACGGD